jgi:hypothetical protein
VLEVGTAGRAGGFAALNIRVPIATERAWGGHLSPGVRPFFVGDEAAQALTGQPLWSAAELKPEHLPLNLLDTLRLYSTPYTRVLWLDEPGWARLSVDERAVLDAEWARLALPRLWWPGEWQALKQSGQRRELLARLTADRLPCRRAELTRAQWQQATRYAPALRRWAGSWAAHSGPNCFGAVMAACGVPGAGEVWMMVAPFVRWLEGAAGPGQPLDPPGADATPTVNPAPGTVLLWRDGQGQPQHAALALDAGLLHQKEAQSWNAPRQVMRWPEVHARWQDEWAAGWTLTGFRLR